MSKILYSILMLFVYGALMVLVALAGGLVIYDVIKYALTF